MTLVDNLRLSACGLSVTILKSSRDSYNLSMSANDWT